MTKKSDDLKERLKELNPEAWIPDGFDGALIGYLEQFGRPIVALYDQGKCIEILMERDKMEYHDAEEYFSFNVLGSGMGEGTPAFATIGEDC